MMMASLSPAKKKSQLTGIDRLRIFLRLDILELDRVK
jgi:hypothetical protein